MTNRVRFLCVLAGVCLVTAGCSTARRTSRLSGSISLVADAPAPVMASMPAPVFGPTPDMAPHGMPGPVPPPTWTPATVAVRSAPSACPSTCGPSPCGLRCERCEGGWHVRALGGVTTFSGDDPADHCDYYGVDVGRSICNSCWSVDAFWRGHTAQFDRDPRGADGGTWNHVGLKITHETSFGGSRWYGWVGAGPEYYWTNGYLQDDRGFGLFGEAGIGYVVNRNLRIRAGVNVHAMDTDAGRRSPADDGESRWLLVLAPVIGLQFDF